MSMKNLLSLQQKYKKENIFEAKNNSSSCSKKKINVDNEQKVETENLEKKTTNVVNEVVSPIKNDKDKEKE